MSCLERFLKKVKLLSCDKALSSKYVYSLEDYKHNLISIIFTKELTIFEKRVYYFLNLIFNIHFLPITLENELFITDDNGESFCVCCLRLLKTGPLSECQSSRFSVFRFALKRQRQTLGTIPCNLLGLYLEKKSTLQHCKTLFGMLRHLHKPLKIFAE